MQLEDSSGQLDAVLIGRDAELFFGGLPPVQQLQQRLDGLVARQVWLDVRVRAMYWEGVASMAIFRIVDTVLA